MDSLSKIIQHNDITLLKSIMHLYVTVKKLFAFLIYSLIVVENFDILFWRNILLTNGREFLCTEIH